MSHNVKDIAKTLRESKKQGTPVVIFTGAGCSKSAGMPLAYELIAEINKKYKGNLRNLSEVDKKDYGICMSKLTPHEQKMLIEKHISKAKINWAHIALASLLKNGYIGKVLTFNFDNILNRACSLDNFFPPIYDLKVLSEEYFTAIPNQSIVHLHGQWSGFQLANSDTDTLSQANKLKNYIKNTINTSPTLFIGYSGGADAFFQLVEENFIGQHRLFWIDYGKEPNTNVKKFLEVNPNHRNFIGEQDADRFLLELAIELKCFPTKLFKDPIKHLKDICEYVNQFPLTTSATEIDILEDTKKTLAIVDANKPNLTTLKLAEALHTHKFDYIINQIKTLDLTLKPISKIVASAYLGKAIEFLRKNDDSYLVFLDKSIQQEPKFLSAYSEIAHEFYHKFQATKQEIHLEKTVEFYEKYFNNEYHTRDLITLANFASALSTYAQLKNDLDLLSKSIKIFKKVIKFEPNHTNFLGNYANALSYLANIKKDEILFHESFYYYDKALTIDPTHLKNLGNYANSLANLAVINSDGKLFVKALELLDLAIEVDPKDEIYLFNYIIMLDRLTTLNYDNSMIFKSFKYYNKILKSKQSQYNLLENFSDLILHFAYKTNNTDCFIKFFECFDKILENEPLNINTLIKYTNALLYFAHLNNDENFLSRAQSLNKKVSETGLNYQTNFNQFINEPWFIELLKRLKAKEEA